MKKSLKSSYLSSTFILLASTVVVKMISAVYKIPLTNYIGAEGRGYFSIAYNLCMPVHALTMGAFPVALTKLVSSCNAKGDNIKITALRKASKRLFLIVGASGLAVMLIFAKPYSSLIASSPKSIYTILTLAPSVFFSGLCACHRAFAEGFIDMKPTAVSQLLEALFKMVFGLLFAKYSMSYLYESYILTDTVFGITVSNEQEALSQIYPLTSAFAMLGVTLGSVASYAFASIYTESKYKAYSKRNIQTKSSCNELVSFAAPLVGATVVSSIANFIDTSSIQYFLSFCDENSLADIYSYIGSDVYTYVFGIYGAVLDFKNLVPSIVMALGVTAVPALSAAYESSSERFSSLLTSIFKYSSLLSIAGGLILSLFSKELLSVFYLSSNPDIVENGSSLLFYTGISILPCALATTTVYSVQALGFAKSTIPAYVLSCAVRLLINFILIPRIEINILSTALSCFVGFFVIVIMNIVTIRKKTNACVSFTDVFFKPVLCGFFAYFITDYIKKSLTLSLARCVVLMLICMIFYFLSLIITKTITPKSYIKTK